MIEKCLMHDEIGLAKTSTMRHIKPTAHLPL
jgi:hypothetical protein